MDEGVVGLVHAGIVNGPAVIVDGPAAVVREGGLVLLRGAHRVEVLDRLRGFLEEWGASLLVDDEAAELQLDGGEAVLVDQRVAR